MTDAEKAAAEQAKAEEAKKAADAKAAEDARAKAADDAKKAADAKAADDAAKAEQAKRTTEVKELEELRAYRKTQERDRMSADDRAKADLAEKDRTLTEMMAAMKAAKESAEAADARAVAAEKGKLEADAEKDRAILGLLVVDNLRSLSFPHVVASGLMRDGALRELADKKVPTIKDGKLTPEAEKTIAEWSAQYAEAMNVRRRSGIQTAGRTVTGDGGGGGARHNNWATRSRGNQ